MVEPATGVTATVVRLGLEGGLVGSGGATAANVLSPLSTASLGVGGLLVGSGEGAKAITGAGAGVLVAGGLLVAGVWLAAGASAAALGVFSDLAGSIGAVVFAVLPVLLEVSDLASAFCSGFFSGGLSAFFS